MTNRGRWIKKYYADSRYVIPLYFDLEQNDAFLILIMYATLP
jgi:hypothetical protein